MGAWIGSSFRFAAAPSAFPVVETTVVTNALNVNPVIINLPSGVTAGDLLLISARHQNRTITLPSGWSLLFDEQFSSGTILRAYAMYKYADGSEGSTVSQAVSGGITSCEVVAYRISGAVGTPEFAKNEASSTSVNCPSLSPTWGSGKTLWLATACSAFASPPSGTPTNYSNKVSSSTVVSAERQFESASDDPSAYTQTNPSAYHAATIAIQGT